MRALVYAGDVRHLRFETLLRHREWIVGVHVRKPWGRPRVARFLAGWPAPAAIRAGARAHPTSGGVRSRAGAPRNRLVPSSTRASADRLAFLGGTRPAPQRC